MTKTKEQKAITLIALIITIVVLLILAIVTIRAVQGDGIITHANDAKAEHVIAQEKEKITLATNGAYLEGKGEITKDNLKSMLNTQFGEDIEYIDETSDEFIQIKIKSSGRQYKVYFNGQIEGPLEVVEETPDVEDPDPGETPPAGGGDDPTTDMPVATVNVKATVDSTINGEAYSSSNPIIPAGFTPINIVDNDATEVNEASSWDAENGPEVNKGLVIQDDNDNQFVWVPLDTKPTPYGLKSSSKREPDVVTGVTPSADVNSASGNNNDALSASLTKAGVTEDLVQNEGDDPGQIDAYDFKKQLENEFDAMADSIEEYKGFYVGRYEVSIDGNTAGSKGTTADRTIYSATDATTSADSWYGLYALCKKYTNGKVKSSMIWGSQYNAMMTWMGDDVTNFNIDNRNTDTQRRTGYEPKDVIRNVYDLCGNSHEWTLEARDTYSRVFRGGNYSAGVSPSYVNHRHPTDTRGYYGSRLTLYIDVAL